LIAFDGQDNHATANSRTLDGFAGKRRVLGYKNLPNFEIDAKVSGGGIEKADHVRIKK